MNNLTYGDPIDLEDCIDVGTVPLDVVPRTITNTGIFAGADIPDEMYNVAIPPHRRAWMTIAYYREKDTPVPWVATVPGLGKLKYTKIDGWESWAVI